MKNLSAVLIVLVCGLSVISCNRNNGCSFSEKAWIRDYSNPTDPDADTCGIAIELENGDKLEPTNLASFASQTFVDGDLVWVSYKSVSGVSTCGVGEIVKLRCIVDRDF